MKKKCIKIFSFLLISIMLCGLIVPTISLAAEETVLISFKDKNLYEYIKSGKRFI